MGTKHPSKRLSLSRERAAESVREKALLCRLAGEGLRAFWDEKLEAGMRESGWADERFQAHLDQGLSQGKARLETARDVMVRSGAMFRAKGGQRGEWSFRTDKDALRFCKLAGLHPDVIQGLGRSDGLNRTVDVGPEAPTASHGEDHGAHHQQDPPQTAPDGPGDP